MEERDYLIILVATLVSLDATVSNVCPGVLKEYIHPDGSKECIFCTECPRGYVKKENCSFLKDTVCEKCLKQFYYVDDEPHCVPCTVCEPGQKLVKNCSQFEDSMCKQCPWGTFSLNQNSLDCKACGSCEGKLVDRKCTPSTDIVCKEHSYLTATWDRLLLAVAVVCFLGAIFFIWLHRKLKFGNKQNNDLEALEGGNQLLDKDEGLGQSSKEEKAEKNEISAEEAAEIAEREATATREAREALDEFKEKMKNRISELSRLRKEIQLGELGLSVGELIIDSSQETIEFEKLEGVVHPYKPQLNILQKIEKHLRDPKIVSERNKTLFFNETQIERIFGIFVGSKYIMTSLHALEKKLDRKTTAVENIVLRIKVAPCVKKDDNIQTYSAKSVPVYKNEPLDVALIEILEPSPFAFPVNLSNLSMHSAFEASEIVTIQDKMILPIHVLTGQDDRKKDFNKFYREKCAKVKFEPDTPKTINEQVHAKHDDVGTNDKMVEGKGVDVNSGRNLKDFDNSTESGNARPGESEINNASKVFWTSDGYVCAGLPCFFFDEKNNMYHLFCISNFPKFYTSLSKVDQKEFRENIKIQYGTSMVALHKDMSVSNKMLCEELFVDLS